MRGPLVGELDPAVVQAPYSQEMRPKCHVSANSIQWESTDKIGIARLPEDAVPVLVHLEDEQTQQWLRVRLEAPKGKTIPQ